MKRERDSERLMALLKSHCAMLAEHFDTVRIFTTADAHENTEAWSWGAGNYWAQYGQVSSWVKRQNGELHARGEKQANCDRDEDEDEDEALS